MPKALIVDDKSENLYLMRTLLAAKGFEVTTASNGQEALRSAEKDPPDILISDVLMPVMDGFTLCREWKKDKRLLPIPFVFYTATYTDPKDEEFALSLGADLFIVKPKDPEELARLILDTFEKFGSGEIARSSTRAPDEEVFFQTYNRTLVRKLEEKVLDLEEANRALAVKDFAIASAISGIILADSAGTLTYANAAFSGMWGYPSGELAGLNIRDLAADKEQAFRVLSVLKTDGRWIGEIEAEKKDGTTFTVQMAAHAVKGSDGNTICLMASCIDVSDQVRMREELQRAQKLESLSLFAAGIAHDFNNLLTGIFNGLDIMRDSLPLQSPAKPQFDMAMSVFERAKDLTRRLLSFTKGETSRRRRLEVEDIVRESCALSLSGSSIRHSVTVCEGPWVVEADANQLSQVFNNIVINARQAMQDQGLMEISIENRVLSADAIGGLPAGDYVSIRFQDTGPGIPENTMPHIFDPFFSTKMEGSGLGLATSYAIAKDHGGHIGASSRPGSGAVFEVWLPALRAGQKEREKTQAPEKIGGYGRILVMDDEETIRELAEYILKKGGYEVTCAESGREALEIYRSAADEHHPFDLVILDLTVRGGMGGEETLAELQRVNPRIAAIASTGYSDEGTNSRLKEAGFLAQLPKPYRSYELLSVVKAVITSRMPSTN